MIDANHRRTIEQIDLGFPNLELVVGSDYIQIRDNDLPSEFNTGRKWRISSFMTKSEVVNTAFAALMAWWEHEAREAFKFRGHAIYGPHHDVEALCEVADRCEYREPVDA